MQEFFNVKILCQDDDTEFAASHTVNTLINALNGNNARLPKILLVVVDMDVINDIDDVFDEDAPVIVQQSTNWLVRQINTRIRRKKLDLYEKNPGAVFGTPSIIFVKMLRRIGNYGSETILAGALSLRAKFNDALNDAVAKTDLRILTITACNTYEDFDHKAMLSIRGKTSFWREIDDLIQKFDHRRVKLLPNPKNPPRVCTTQTKLNDSCHRASSGQRNSATE